MNTSYGPADAQAIGHVAAGLAVPQLEGLSAPLLAELEEHAAECSELKATIGRLEEAPAKAMEACRSGDFGAVFGVVDCAQVNKAEVCQLLTCAWAKKSELAQKAVTELKALLPAAEAEYAAVVETVKAQLVEIGSGPESYVSHGHNEKSAHHQFEWDVRNKNARVRAAAAEVADVLARIGSATEHVHAALRGAAEAQKFIERMVARMVGT